MSSIASFKQVEVLIQRHPQLFYLGKQMIEECSKPAKTRLFMQKYIQNQKIEAMKFYSSTRDSVNRRVKLWKDVDAKAEDKDIAKVVLIECYQKAFPRAFVVERLSKSSFLHLKDMWIYQEVDPWVDKQIQDISKASQSKKSFVRERAKTNAFLGGVLEGLFDTIKEGNEVDKLALSNKVARYIKKELFDLIVMRQFWEGGKGRDPVSTISVKAVNSFEKKVALPLIKKWTSPLPPFKFDGMSVEGYLHKQTASLKEGKPSIFEELYHGGMGVFKDGITDEVKYQIFLSELSKLHEIVSSAEIQRTFLLKELMVTQKNVVVEQENKALSDSLLALQMDVLGEYQNALLSKKEVGQETQNGEKNKDYPKISVHSYLARLYSIIQCLEAFPDVDEDFSGWVVLYRVSLNTLLNHAYMLLAGVQEVGQKESPESPKGKLSQSNKKGIGPLNFRAAFDVISKSDECLMRALGGVETLASQSNLLFPLTYPKSKEQLDENLLKWAGGIKERFYNKLFETLEFEFQKNHEMVFSLAHPNTVGEMTLQDPGLDRALQELQSTSDLNEVARTLKRYVNKLWKRDMQYFRHHVENFHKVGQGLKEQRGLFDPGMREITKYPGLDKSSFFMDLFKEKQKKLERNARKEIDATLEKRLENWRRVMNKPSKKSVHPQKKVLMLEEYKSRYPNAKNLARLKKVSFGHVDDMWLYEIVDSWVDKLISETKRPVLKSRSIHRKAISCKRLEGFNQDLGVEIFISKKKGGEVDPLVWADKLVKSIKEMSDQEICELLPKIEKKNDPISRVLAMGNEHFSQEVSPLIRKGTERVHPFKSQKFTQGSLAWYLYGRPKVKSELERQYGEKIGRFNKGFDDVGKQHLIRFQLFRVYKDLFDAKKLLNKFLDEMGRQEKSIATESRQNRSKSFVITPRSARSRSISESRDVTPLSARRPSLDKTRGLVKRKNSLGRNRTGSNERETGSLRSRAITPLRRRAGSSEKSDNQPRRHGSLRRARKKSIGNRPMSGTLLRRADSIRERVNSLRMLQYQLFDVSQKFPQGISLRGMVDEMSFSLDSQTQLEGFLLRLYSILTGLTTLEEWEGTSRFGQKVNALSKTLESVSKNIVKAITDKKDEEDVKSEEVNFIKLARMIEKTEVDFLQVPLFIGAILEMPGSVTSEFVKEKEGEKKWLDTAIEQWVQTARCNMLEKKCTAIEEMLMQDKAAKRRLILLKEDTMRQIVQYSPFLKGILLEILKVEKATQEHQKSWAERILKYMKSDKFDDSILLHQHELASSRTPIGAFALEAFRQLDSFKETLKYWTETYYAKGELEENPKTLRGYLLLQPDWKDAIEDLTKERRKIRELPNVQKNVWKQAIKDYDKQEPEDLRSQKQTLWSMKSQHFFLRQLADAFQMLLYALKARTRVLEKVGYNKAQTEWRKERYRAVRGRSRSSSVDLSLDKDIEAKTIFEQLKVDANTLPDIHEFMLNIYCTLLQLEMLTVNIPRLPEERSKEANTTVFDLKQSMESLKALGATMTSILSKSERDLLTKSRRRRSARPVRSRRSPRKERGKKGHRRNLSRSKKK